MKKVYSTGIIVTVFSIAMAFLETSVVVYLRELLYPGGFDFPLAPIPSRLALTEILREAATIIMLLGAGIMAGKNLRERFAWFLYSFAVWDIFYYVFLKLLINWPASWFTWDILFLIPTTWTGPVISPIIVSLTMIILAAEILYFSSRLKSNISFAEWLLLIIGSVIIVISFTYDYSSYILSHLKFAEIWKSESQEQLKLIALQYIPRRFNWYIFISGELVILASIFRYFYRQTRD